MSSEKEKMLMGELYDPRDPELARERLQARRVIADFNASAPEATAERERLVRALCGAVGADVWIEPPFFCDYGSNIALGDRVFVNFNCVFLDVARITVGDDALFGPGVQLLTATHPLSATQRRTLLELGRPIAIGAGAWLGGGVIVLPGVRIGDGAVIGAGSVVTRDVPAGVIAAGNPCRVLREAPP